MGTNKTTKLENGERVWLESDGYSQWIFFEDDDGQFDETSGQSVPVDSLDYRYTHGGALYREACEKLEIL